jgi:adenylate cyclase
VTVFRFERFSLDLTRGRLRDGERDIELRPKSFEVLRYLVENADRLASKDEIVTAIWPKVQVSDDSLTRCMSDIRLALGDADQRIIKTVLRRGYMFIAPVSKAEGSVALPLPDRSSIAVLPFTNRGGDPQQDYFTDGISEDLMTSLSKFAGLFVIARHSAFRYRGTDLDARTIGRELGVRYLLVGSVRHDAQRIRITAQLVDAGTSEQLWAEHYDRELTGIFAVQDEVIQKIIGTLIAHISRSEIERARTKPPETFSAYDYWLRGNAIMKRWEGDATGEKLLEARTLFQRAIDADPAYVPPLCGLARTYSAAWIEPWSHKALTPEYQQPETLERGLFLAQRAVELAPHLSDARLELAAMLLWLHRSAESRTEFECSLELNPNLADYRFALALTRWGRSEEAIEHLKRMIRYDPFHAPTCLTFLGNAYYLIGRYTDAIGSLRTAARRSPTFRPTFVWLAATAAHLGYDEEAREAGSVLLRRDPAFTIKKWLQLHQYVKADADQVARGLRLAKLPE